jgi:hypothetical protein
MSQITKYLSRIAAKGGHSKSPAKVAAARENGKKGGRPKKAAATKEAK